MRRILFATAILLGFTVVVGCFKKPADDPAVSRKSAQATLSEQKMCADQALKNFNESSFSTPDKTSMGNTYTSHYDPTASVCYMEVTTRNMRETTFQYYHLIYDAFEGRAYGSFMEFSGDRHSMQECSVTPRNGAKIACTTSDEFDALALKYFGTTAD